MITDIHIFDLYKEKASGVLRDRNTFLSLYSSTLLAVFLPLAYAGQIAGILENSTLATLFLVTIGVFIYLFCELKYREYRWGYMMISIRNICEKEIIPKYKPKTYDEMCEHAAKRTLYLHRHILPILRKLYPPKPDFS